MNMQLQCGRFDVFSCNLLVALSTFQGSPSFLPETYMLYNKVLTNPFNFHLTTRLA